MNLTKSMDLLELKTGQLVSKRNLFDLIQFSKVKDSLYWSGIDNIIGNTPQQGINWFGSIPKLKCVIIKTRPGVYVHDNWTSDYKYFIYSFKEKNGNINYMEKANSVLIDQLKYKYPILLFCDRGNMWLYEGLFSVVSIDLKFVKLEKINS